MEHGGVGEVLWLPSQLFRSHSQSLTSIKVTDPARVWRCVCLVCPFAVRSRSKNSVEPGALILILAHSEWGARELLSYQSHRALLRVVASYGQSTLLRLTLKVVSEPVIVAEILPTRDVDGRLFAGL